MTASATSALKSLGYNPDTGNYLLASPVVSDATTTPFAVGPTKEGVNGISAPTPAGMSGPYGPGSVIFSMSMPQSESFSLGTLDDAGIGADLFTGSAGDEAGDFRDMGGNLTATDLVAWNGAENNTAVANDLQNGDGVAAFKNLNDAATYLQSQLPSYTPGASFIDGLAKLVGIGGACAPAYGAAGTALGAIAQAYSGGGGLGPALKAAGASLLSTALLVPMAACYVAVSGGLHDNDVNYAVNVLGNSAINATNHFMQSYINGGLGVPPGSGGLAISGSVSPDYAVGTGVGTMTTAELGSVANIKLEAAGMAASLEAYQAQGHHANFLTGVFT